MLLDEIDKYIQEAELNEKIWKGVTAPKISIEEFIMLSEDDRVDIFDTLDEEVQQQILKLQEGGLL